MLTEQTAIWSKPHFNNRSSSVIGAFRVNQSLHHSAWEKSVDTSLSRATGDENSNR